MNNNDFEVIHILETFYVFSFLNKHHYILQIVDTLWSEWTGPMAESSPHAPIHQIQALVVNERNGRHRSQADLQALGMKWDKNIDMSGSNRSETRELFTGFELKIPYMTFFKRCTWLSEVPHLL